MTARPFFLPADDSCFKYDIQHPVPITSSSLILAGNNFDRLCFIWRGSPLAVKGRKPLYCQPVSQNDVRIESSTVTYIQPPASYESAVFADASKIAIRYRVSAFLQDDSRTALYRLGFRGNSGTVSFLSICFLLETAYSIRVIRRISCANGDVSHTQKGYR